MPTNGEMAAAISLPATQQDRLPPTEPLDPSDPDVCEEDADKNNTAILTARGYRTTASGRGLHMVALLALHNLNISVTSQPHDNESMDKASDDDTHAFYAALSSFGVTTFEPFYFFFYGTLQIPSVLASVLFKEFFDDEEKAETSTALLTLALSLRGKGSLKGWKVRMWGPFATLLPGDDDDKVRGAVYLCENPEEVRRLCSYQTAAFRLAYCDVEVPASNGQGRDVEVIKNARFFILANDADTRDCEFNVAEYEQKHRSHVRTRRLHMEERMKSCKGAW